MLDLDCLNLGPLSRLSFMTAPPELGVYLEWGRSPGDPLGVERRHLSLRCPEARPRWCLDREANLKSFHSTTAEKKDDHPIPSRART